MNVPTVVTMMALTMHGALLANPSGIIVQLNPAMPQGVTSVKMNVVFMVTVIGGVI